MSRDLGDRGCDKCHDCRSLKPDGELKCFSPTIVQVYPNGRDLKDARGSGRFCGPAGDFFRRKT